MPSGIRRLSGIQQRADQRRRDAGADDDRRQRAHDEHAGKMAAMQLVAGGGDPALQGSRQLQLVEAEHG
jgi:hypothetical protein